MRNTVIYDFTDEDIELLKKDLPNNPCSKCGRKYSCCGCPDGSKYDKVISPYVDNNIYEMALKIKVYKQELKTLQEVKERCISKFNKLPAEIQDILKEQGLAM